MNVDAIAALLWLVLTGAVFALPFLPALWELRAPGDAGPLTIGGMAARLQGTNLLGPVHEWPALAEVVDIAQAPCNSVGTVRLDERMPDVHVRHDDALILGTTARIRAIASADTVYLEGGAFVRDALFAHSIFCLGKLRLPRLTEAEYRLCLAPGVTFFKLYARLVTTSVDARDADARDAWEGAPASATREIHRGDWKVQAGTTLRGHFVVTGDLECLEGVQILGSVKVHGDAVLHPHALIDGNLFAMGAIKCVGGVRVSGHLSSQSKVTIGRGSQIGTPRRPVQVIGSTVVLARDVRIFGGVSTMYGGTVV